MEPASARTATATILFTDLVDSTAQRARLGEETAETLRRAHDRLLTEAVAAHHGQVTKSVGDGVMATFPGAADAVAAAVAIQQGIDAHNRRAGAPLAVRVGISLGDVAWEQGDCFGAPVIEAARLCAAAEGGQILVADVVRLTARGRGGHTFAPVGPVALKGLPEPVVACAVAWEPREQVGLPLPPKLGARPAFAMFGRREEEAALALAWAKARDGQRQVVLLAGEPGIGKTRLATEAARAAHAEGGTVLFGGCDEDVGLPYRPFVEALRHYVAHAPDHVLAAHVRAHRGELARLVPELAQRVPDLPALQVAEAETERFLLFEAAAGLLAVASQESPIVLVLDDLHWAGAPELLLLKHLIRSAQPMRLLVVGTYRDTDISRGHPLTAVLADLRRESGVERMALHGLDDAAVEGLLAAAARHDLDDALVALAHAIRRETEGNPFFIGEVIRHLSESSVLFQEGGRWTYRGEIDALGIPEGVREVIGRRLGRLSQATTRILSVAAVIGRQFDLALLSKVADTSEDAALDALDEATAAALVSEVRGSRDAFTFRHTLIRTTLYEELSATRRARLHRRIGEALEELVEEKPGARIEELAYHWLAATQAADAAKAIVYARRAGDRALAKLAPAQALRWYNEAFALLDDAALTGREGLEVRIGLGEAQKISGDRASRVTLIGAARDALERGHADLGVRAALACSRVYWTSAGRVDEEYVAVVRAALDAVGPDDSPARARLLSLLAVELVWRRDGRDDETVALADDAIGIARRLGDDALLVDVVARSHHARSTPENTETRWRDETEALVAANRTADPVVLLDAHWARSYTAVDRMDRAAIDHHVDALERLGEKLGSSYYTSRVLTHIGVRTGLDGDPEAASRSAHRQLESLVEAGAADAFVIAGPAIAHAAWIAGQLGVLLPKIEHDRDKNPTMQTYPAYLAWAYAWEHQHETAERLVSSAYERGFAAPRNTFWLVIQALWADAAYTVRHAPSAAVLCARLEPWTDLLASMKTSALLAVAHYAGLARATLGDLDLAVDHLEHAIGRHRALRAPFYVACSEVALAEVLLQRGTDADRERAQALAQASLAVARQRGYPYIERDARAILDRLRLGEGELT